MDRNVDEVIWLLWWSIVLCCLWMLSIVGGGCEWDGEFIYIVREWVWGGVMVCEWGVEMVVGGVFEFVMLRVMLERWWSYVINGGVVKKWDLCVVRKEGGWVYDFILIYFYYYDDDVGCCLCLFLL